MRVSRSISTNVSGLRVKSKFSLISALLGNFKSNYSWILLFKVGLLLYISISKGSMTDLYGLLAITVIMCRFKSSFVG